MNVSLVLCDHEFTATSLQHCTIEPTVYYVMKVVTLTIASISLAIDMAVCIKLWKHLLKKPWPTRVILMVISAINLVLILRTTLTLWVGINSRTSIWMHLIVSLFAVLAIGAVILYIFIELRTIHKGSLRSLAMTRSREIGILVFFIITSLLFMSGPLVHTYTDIPSRFTFWITVAFGNLVVPYYCYVNYILYGEIKRLRRPAYNGIAKKLLYSSIVCGSCASVTFIFSIVITIYPQVEWIGFEICMISAALFYNAMSVVFYRKTTDRRIPTSTTSSASIDDVDTNGESLA